MTTGLKYYSYFGFEVNKFRRQHQPPRLLCNGGTHGVMFVLTDVCECVY